MCGIAGLVDHGCGDVGTLERVAKAMGDALTHRGPDSGGVIVDAEAGLAMAHRRLAILDLSPAGAQPMRSHDGRLVIVYNGEVYNSLELQTDLPGIAWRGHSDTEVVLEACAKFGPFAAARRFIGMFAFAVWDRRLRKLTLVRDRLGIKPLYWTHRNGAFAFASELKALRLVPGFEPEVDRAALSSFLRLGYVPAPSTIYAGVHQLQPGCVLTFSAGCEPEIETFWSLSDVVRRTRADAQVPDDEEAAADMLELLLRDAVKRRMVADVPLGAFLSGGIDSSLVTALMQVQSSRPIKTYTIGFEEKAYDEAPHAHRVAGHLATDHTELYLSEADALGVVSELPTMFDEPFADASQIPTFLVSKLARSGVTVALSGDGGDELFAGYSRYSLEGRLRPIFAGPLAVRAPIAAAIQAVPPAWLDHAVTVLPASLRPNMFGDRTHKFADLLRLPDLPSVYRRLVSYWERPLDLTGAPAEASADLVEAWCALDLADPVERMQFIDTRTYLPDDILTKIDRASMAVALEARVPLLDHRVVELAWSLPMRHKLRGGKTKWLLRKVLARHVPPELFERPKAGFSLPIEHWLRGKLRDWAEDLLEPSSMRASGFIDPAPVQQAWREHCSGVRNRQYPLWAVLMFEAWRRRWAA